MIVPVNIGPDSHYQQQSYQTLHSQGRSFFSGPTFYMTTEFEVSVIVRLFSLRGRIQMCVFGVRGGGGGGWGGEGGKEIKANGKFRYQYPILTSCEKLTPRAKSDV